MSELKLNLGAGQTYLPGFQNVDIVPWADICLDLNVDPLPFEDNSVDCIFTFHLLEHLDNYLAALGEIHRVLKHGGRFLVGVPYLTLTQYNLVNPYHRQHFNEFSFDFFDRDKLKGSAVEDNPILFKKLFHTFNYFRPFKLMPNPLRYLCRRYLLNVVHSIDFGLLAIKAPHQTIEIRPGDEQRLKAEFAACLNARTKYPEARIRQARAVSYNQSMTTKRFE